MADDNTGVFVGYEMSRILTEPKEFLNFLPSITVSCNLSPRSSHTLKMSLYKQYLTLFCLDII